MEPKDFSGILTRGGTILGTARTPFKKMRKIEEDGVDKVKNMLETYKALNLDCLVCLGGAGTHKNANLLREEGLNVIGLPKQLTMISGAQMLLLAFIVRWILPQK